MESDSEKSGGSSDSDGSDSYSSDSYSSDDDLNTSMEAQGERITVTPPRMKTQRERPKVTPPLDSGSGDGQCSIVTPDAIESKSESHSEIYHNSSDGEFSEDAFLDAILNVTLPGTPQSTPPRHGSAVDVRSGGEDPDEKGAPSLVTPLPSRSAVAPSSDGCSLDVNETSVKTKNDQDLH